DGVTGHLVAAGDVEGAAAALGTVSLLARAACREHARTALSLDDAVSAHEELYTRLPTTL
ncbi:MAG: hypothetical protein M3R48_06670, partial [Candidatus Dormibacteraeota bacterium]|nr:hypothetical protein [Candidatus Dormibacteraeota bacterium]